MSALRARVVDVLTHKLSRNAYTPQGSRPWGEVLPEIIGDAAEEIESMLVTELAQLADRVVELERRDHERRQSNLPDEDQEPFVSPIGFGPPKILGADASLPAFEGGYQVNVKPLVITESNAAPHDFCADCYRGDCAEHRGRR